MKTKLWTIDFDLGFRRSRLYVSASTVKMAIKNAVRGYNKGSEGVKVTSRQITMVCYGRKNGEITCGGENEAIKNTDRENGQAD